ncbi:MALT paracaspase 2 isoform X1 [Silurus meridionalis]|uniref:Mucosa-associated lymphoid tissue lymphoma translocation protein 1 n=1 Tax=Silurus meridionalis TaxID=175797 RepID=A0A8T0BBH2_SILME
MDEWNLGLETLNEVALNRLAEMLDNSNCGWRQLAAAFKEQSKFFCSEKEMTSCSLQVLNARGSPSRYLLSLLAEKKCPLALLLQCLKKIEHHNAASLLTTYVEPIKILTNPQTVQVPIGSTVTLVCKAVGPPGLTYQWFRKKEEVPGGNASELILKPAQEGSYICRVNSEGKYVFSGWAYVRVFRPYDSGSEVSFPSSVSRLCITEQPRAQLLSEGDTLLLECSAQGNPPPQFQWYHNQQPLLKAIRHFIKIPCVTTADRGVYRCRVFTPNHELWSDNVQVEIGPGSCAEAYWEANDEHKADSLPRQMGDLYATDKVALLMGNMNYAHHRELRAPMADVYELSNLLRQLDFKVVSLLDLNRHEMHRAVSEFLLLLGRGVYGLLYFAGHGYENYGNSFMVPIDAPASYTSDHCLWVQDVLQRMQERQTGLNVFLLDMCRKRNLNDDIIQQPGPLKVTANIVFGYATCVDAEAFEVNKDDLSNGIFMSFLKKRLMEQEKVTVMLDRVAEDMGRCELTRGRQALELRSNLSERRTLTDRIQAPECPVMASTRNLQWSIAHALPESRVLQFDCGVKVQLGFAAEFSNIMIIYTRILETPADIRTCSAELSDFTEGPEVDLKRTNQASLRDAGSLLLVMDDRLQQEQPRLFTRLCALQRLKNELSFTVCLHFQYDNLDEAVHEQRNVTVGKPLVSKLNLHEPHRLHTSTASFSSDLQSTSMPLYSSFAQDLQASLPSFTSASFAESTDACFYTHPGISSASDLRRINEPEENISPEFLMSVEPRASKSLTHAAVDKPPNFSHFHSF